MLASKKSVNVFTQISVCRYMKYVHNYISVPKRVTSVQAITSDSRSVAVTWLPDSNSFQTGFRISYRVGSIVVQNLSRNIEAVE